MWLWTRQEAKKIDERTQHSGISTETLMESAGRQSAEQIHRLHPRIRSVVLLCGPGHNGGDGFVVARHLWKLGYKTRVIELSSTDSSELRQKKKTQYQGPLQTVEESLHDWPSAELWIDGLFGIGLSRPLDEPAHSLLENVNASPGFKVALDTPSGLDVDTGRILGACFRAQVTLTVGHPKPGFFLNEGPSHCGRVRCLDIGFPPEIYKKEARKVFLLSRSLVRRWIPQRQATDNKTCGGRTLILAGSEAMPGAAILACRAAKRVGAGYVYTSEPEVLRFTPETIPWSAENLSSFQAALIGPGLGAGKKTARLLQNLKKEKFPVVVDADALTVAAREELFPFPANWLATPHAGEMARMLGVSASEIESDRLFFARRCQELLGCSVLLKGFHSVLAFEKFSVIVPTGNVALAKGGSGDVLAGMIAGLLSQGVSQGISHERAFLLGTYLHGAIADQWVRSGKDYLSLAPSDLIEAIPEALHDLRRGAEWEENS